jgi:hypothetical protein
MENIVKFSLEFENCAIKVTLADGGIQTLMKEESKILMDEEADIQSMLMTASKQHTKDLLHFRLVFPKAQVIWKSLKANGWK